MAGWGGEKPCGYWILPCLFAQLWAALPGALGGASGPPRRPVPDWLSWPFAEGLLQGSVPVS